MIPRPSLLVFASLLIAGTAAAQNEPPKKPAPVKATSKPTGQDQKKQDPATAQIDTTAQLKKSRDIAVRETKFLEQVLQGGGLLARLKKNRKLAQQMVDTFAPEAFGPAAPKRRVARLLGDAEKAQLAEDVLFTVESTPVTKKEYDEMLAYLRSYPSKDGMGSIETQAIQHLVNRKAPLGVYKKKAAEAFAVISAIKQKLDGGEKFRDLVQRYSDDKETSEHGGKREEMERGTMDANYAMHAFDLQIGKVSGIVASAEGYHLIRLLGMKKGDSADKDRIKTSHIVRRYATLDELSELTRRIREGEIDLAFRESNLRESAPKQFQK